MIGDAHCHLSLLQDAVAAAEEALARGVSPILAVSMDADEAEAVLRLRETCGAQVLAGAGLHPSRVVELDEAGVRDHLARLANLSEEADFIGEIGLDFRDAVTAAQQDRQREVLAELLALAMRRKLPVNLHTRRADREVMEAAISFRRQSGLGAVMHWFTRSSRLARSCGEAGVFISVGPSVLPGPPDGGGDAPTPTQRVASVIDTACLLVETDAPVSYGPLGAARPAWARDVADALSSLRGTDHGETDRMLADNLRRYLGRSVA